MDWRRTKVAPDGTHHTLDGEPLYAARYRDVLKFHAPGLAPVLGDDGATHVGMDGVPVYEQRHHRTFGFYEGLAAVDSGDGWFHIHPDGRRAYAARWAWCGNVQGGRCTVRRHDGRYQHINCSGERLGTRTWRYAGDYRNGVGVVQGDDGLHSHVDERGEFLHSRWFLDLDVFHKGFARARDSRGWTHVDQSGVPLYERRFAAVEPFYNGQARVERFDGGLEVIDERAERVVELRPDTRVQQPRSGRVTRVLLIGLAGAGKTTVGELLAAKLGLAIHRLDDFRRTFADGSVAGDYLARSAFLRACGEDTPSIYEFSAAGYHRVAVRQAFMETGDSLLTVWIDTPTRVRRERLSQRRSSVPLPDWGIQAGAFDEAMEAKLQGDFDSGWWLKGPGWRAIRLAGTRPAEELARTIAITLNATE